MNLFQVVLRQPVQGILGDVNGTVVKEPDETWSSGVKYHETAVLQKLSTFKVNFTVSHTIKKENLSLGYM